MENEGIINRVRSAEDERKVIVCLTEAGKALQEEAQQIPQYLINRLLEGKLDLQGLIRLKENIESIISLLSEQGS